MAWWLARQLPSSQAMDEACIQREQLILEHLQTIRYIASHFSAMLPPSVELGDLVGEGVFGLLSAAERFDPARGVKFKTYAETRIRGAILDSLRNQDWLPRSERRRYKRLSRALKDLEQRLGRPASANEIFDEFGTALEEFRRLAALSKPLPECIWNSNHGSGTARVQPETTDFADCREDVLVRIHRDELSVILANAVAALPRRERVVISLYYYDELTMKEIGRVLGVKESRVSQFHSRAKARLHKHLKRLLLSGQGCVTHSFGGV